MPESENSNQFRLQIPKHIREEIDEAARDEGITVEEFIRRAVRAKVEQLAKQKSQ